MVQQQRNTNFLNIDEACDLTTESSDWGCFCYENEKGEEWYMHGIAEQIYHLRGCKKEPHPNLSIKLTEEKTYLKLLKWEKTPFNSE